jgi:hypothetical protein
VVASHADQKLTLRLDALNRERAKQVKPAMTVSERERDIIDEKRNQEYVIMYHQQRPERQRFENVAWGGKCINVTHLALAS